MAPRAGTPEQYAEEMGALWTGLNSTLGRLDRIASDLDQFDDVQVESSLRRLQYALHLASEHAYGVVPPAGAQTAHAELAAALCSARDATAAIADAAADAEDVEPFLPEWRGALFRVRLARLRLAVPATERPQPEPEPADGIARPLAAVVLALAGALAFVAGATLGVWPLWVVGLVAVCGSLLVFRP